MTREEAINKLTECAKDKLWGCGEYSEALEMAIQALQTQADGDLISRTSVLDVLKIYKVNLTVIDIIRGLPITNMTIPPDHDGCENCRYQDKDEYEMPCRECQQNYKDMWEKKPHLIEVDDMIYKCSECGCDDIVGKWNFCPNCGAKMD